MNGKLPTWAQMANDYFGAGLDEASALRWQDEMKHSLKGANPSDVCDAIRANATTNLKRKLTVADIIGWVKGGGSSEAQKITRSCNLCHKGLIRFAPELDKDDFSIVEFGKAGHATIPCVCGSGGARMKEMRIEGSALESNRKKAVAQASRLNKLFAEYGKEHKNEKASSVCFR